MKAASRSIRFLRDFESIEQGVETNKLHPVLTSKLVKAGVAEWVDESHPVKEKKTIQKKPKTERKK